MTAPTNATPAEGGTLTNPTIVTTLRRAARGACAVAIVTGAVVLLMRILGMPAPGSVFPTLVRMKANTAVCLVLLGAALASRLNPRRGSAPVRAGTAGALTAATVGAASLLEDLTGWDFGIDQLLARDPEALSAAPGRMAPATAVSFVLLGAAVLTLDAPSRRPYAQGFAVGALLVSMVSLLGYAYGVRHLYAIGAFSPIALHTALALAVLSLGALCARPERGPMAVLVSDTAAGTAARRLVPALVVVPFVFGWLRLAGQRAGFYGTEFGAAILVASTIVAFVTLALRAARAAALDEVERARLQEALTERVRTRSEASIASLNATLREAMSSADQKAAARVEERFRTLVMSVPIALFATDAAGRCVFVNPTWSELTGLSDAEASGEGWARALHPDDRARVLDGWRAAAASGAPFSLEYRYLTPRGETAWVVTSAVRLHDSGGYLGTVVDVTERLRADRVRAESEAVLRASLAEKETLLREIHHRVKNNLQMVASLINLQAAKDPAGPARAFLDELRGRVHAIALLHERLYRSGNLARIDLRDYVPDLVAELVRASDGDGRVAVTTSVDELYLDMDTALPVGLIVQELLTNAFKHAFPPQREGRGKVSVEVSRRGGLVEVVVADDGVGFRGPVDVDAAGTLGLQLVDGLARQIDGEFTVERAEGARCVVRFPEPRREE